MQLSELVYVLLPAYVREHGGAVCEVLGWNHPISCERPGDHETVVGFLLGGGRGRAHVVRPVSRFAVASWLRACELVRAGCTQGVGAMTGDAVKSFFKRQVGVAPGVRWIPADEIDFIIGAMVLGSPWLDLTAVDVVLVLGFTFVAHIIIVHGAFGVGIATLNGRKRHRDCHEYPA